MALFFVLQVSVAFLDHRFTLHPKRCFHTRKVKQSVCSFVPSKEGAIAHYTPKGV